MSIIKEMSIIPNPDNSQKAERDVFDRLRTSYPSSVLVGKATVFDDAHEWENKVYIGGTTSHSTFRASVSLNTSTTSDRIVRQTRYPVVTSPQGNQVFIVSNLNGQVVGCTKRVGAYNDSNGIFFENDGTNSRWVIRSQVSGGIIDLPVNQNIWNLDTYDGAGNSGATLDLSLVQEFLFDYSWISGVVRCGFRIGDKLLYTHEFDTTNMNVSSSVLMSIFNLPIRYEINNISVGTPQSIECIGYKVINEDVTNSQSKQYSANIGRIPKLILSGVTDPLISLRRINTVTDALVIPKSFNLLVTSAQIVLWQVILNPTVATTTPANWVSKSNCVEVDVTEVGDVSGGTIIDSGYTTGSSDPVNIEISLRYLTKMGLTLDGISDVLTLAITATDFNETCLSSVTWDESH